MPVTRVVITIRSYYSRRMPGVPPAERYAERGGPGREKNRAVEHSAALSRHAHRACTLVCLSSLFPPAPLPSLPPPHTLVIIKESVPPSIMPLRLYRFDKQRQRVRAGS